MIVHSATSDTHFGGWWTVITVLLCLVLLLIIALRRAFKPRAFKVIVVTMLVAIGPWFLLGLGLNLYDMHSDYSQTSTYTLHSRYRYSHTYDQTEPTVFAYIPLFVIGALGTAIDAKILWNAVNKRKQPHPPASKKRPARSL